jgi:enterochelin esterase-like enzyme
MTILFQRMKSLLFALSALAVFPSLAIAQDAISLLEPDAISGLKWEMQPNSSHKYSIALDSGEGLLASVMQTSVDVVVDILSPTQRLIQSVDKSAVGELEVIQFTATEAGEYTIVVRPYNQEESAGSYIFRSVEILDLDANTVRVARQTYPTETLFNLWQFSRTNDHAISAFIDQHADRHIIEAIPGNKNEMLVTYFTVAGDDTEYVMQSGGPDYFGLRFQRMPGTHFFYVVQKVPNDARFIYGFNYFKLQTAGPAGEIELRDMFHGYDSVVVMPEAPRSAWLAAREGGGTGKLVQQILQSRYMEEERSVTVYTPPDFNPTVEHALLVVFDGEDYASAQGNKPDWGNWVAAPRILDNLSADNSIRPTIAIFVDSMGKRGSDLPSKAFANFVALEIIPWARIRYSIADGPSHVVLAGASRGGYAAANIAYEHPEVVGNVLSQSGSFWIKGAPEENHPIWPSDDGRLIKLLKQSDRLPIRFYMEVGLYDVGSGMLGTNRQLRDILELKGYELDYREFNGGHAYANWRVSFADGLISLLRDF